MIDATFPVAILTGAPCAQSLCQDHRHRGSTHILPTLVEMKILLNKIDLWVFTRSNDDARYLWLGACWMQRHRKTSV
jgi:hypothetical protein